MDREALKQILPHRGRMLLLDKAWRKDNEAKGVYTVRGDEFFLNGHFPGAPIVPGVILCEMMAQSACVLLQDKDVGDSLPMYAGMDRVRFRSPVRPGDRIDITCRITRMIGRICFAEGEVFVGQRRCAEARFSFALVQQGREDDV